MDSLNGYDSRAEVTECNSVSVVNKSSEKMGERDSQSLDSGHGKWLLAAVRRIRDQKQRPNINRIMNTLRIICPGEFGSRELVMEELELAVSKGILLRVGAVGDNCSYRDPGRSVRLKSHSLHVTCDLDMTKVVARSVRELADPAGSTVIDLHRYIQSGYNVHIHDNSDLMTLIAKYCQKGVEVGKLVCVEDSSERRYQAAHTGTKKSTVNCTKKLSPSISTYSLIDRAFKTDVSDN